jgi:hypothetical protein
MKPTIISGAAALAAGALAMGAGAAAGVEGRPEGSTDLVPYWVQAADGGAAIERTVLAQPLSREVGRTGELRRALAVYRLAFGQPRQEDLLAYLEQVMSPEQLMALAAELRIDLTPPALASA